MWLVCFCSNAAVFGSLSCLPTLDCTSPGCISHGGLAVRSQWTQSVPACLNCRRCCGHRPVGEETGVVRNLTSHEMLHSVSWLFPDLEDFLPRRKGEVPFSQGQHTLFASSHKSAEEFC